MPLGDPPEPGERGQYDRHEHSCNRALEIIALNLVETRKLLHALVSHVCEPSSDNNAILRGIAHLQESINIMAKSQAELAADLRGVVATQEKIALEIKSVKDAVEVLKTDNAELLRIIGEGGEVTPELEAAAKAVVDQTGVVDKLIDDLPIVQPA